MRLWHTRHGSLNCGLAIVLHAYDRVRGKRPLCSAHSYELHVYRYRICRSTWVDTSLELLAKRLPVSFYQINNCSVSIVCRIRNQTKRDL